MTVQFACQLPDHSQLNRNDFETCGGFLSRGLQFCTDVVEVFCFTPVSATGALSRPPRLRTAPPRGIAPHIRGAAVRPETARMDSKVGPQ